MSTAPRQTPTQQAQPRQSAWKSLLGLVPYLRRHTGGIALGMLTQAAMGLTGTLLPLIIGAIVDCVNGAREPLAQLGRVSHLALGFLLPYYHPLSKQTLAIFCTALILVCALQGLFSF